MFRQLYFGELKKLARPKSLITLGIIMTVLLVFYAIGYNVIIEMGESFSDQTAEEAEPLGDDELTDGNEIIFETPGMQIGIDDIMYGRGVVNVNEEEIDALIAGQKAEIKHLEEMNTGDFLRNLGYDPIYEAKSYLKAYEHIKTNKLYGRDIEIYSQTAVFSQKSAEAFAQGFYGLLLTVIIIYGIVIGAGSFSSEMKNGTLKMLFMRPITRNKLTTAKIISLFTMVGLILLGGTLISYLYGIIKYGVAAATKGLIVFNAMSVFEGTKGLIFFMNIMFGLLQAFALCLFAFAFGTVTKNRVLAIITCILTYLGLISGILSLFKLGRFLFTTNANLGLYFGVTAEIPAGGNFFIALPFFIAYVSIFLAASYIVFNKRDIA